jgi:hypothetical protein
VGNSDQFIGHRFPCPRARAYDLNNDGKIDMKDIGLVSRDFGEFL